MLPISLPNSRKPSKAPEDETPVTRIDMHCRNLKRKIKKQTCQQVINIVMTMSSKSMQSLKCRISPPPISFMLLTQASSKERQILCQCQNHSDEDGVDDITIQVFFVLFLIG